MLICLLCSFEQRISWRSGPMVLEPLPASLETGSRSSSRLRVSLAPLLSFIKLSGASVCLFLVFVYCVGWRWVILVEFARNQVNQNQSRCPRNGRRPRTSVLSSRNSILSLVRFLKLVPLFPRIPVLLIGFLTVFFLVFTLLFLPLYQYLWLR